MEVVNETTTNILQSISSRPATGVRDLAEALGMSFYEAEAWFVHKGLHRDYGVDELEEDRRTLDQLLPGS